MPNARKLPSGNYNCLVFSHYDYSTGKKKKIYESFTAPTAAEAEMMAAEWKASRKSRGTDITVAEAIERYIAAKTAVLSPSTIRGYRSYQRTAFDKIGAVKLRQLDAETVQIWISCVSAAHSPKTTRNIYGLLSSALNMFLPGTTFCVALPAKRKQQYNLPPDEDIQKLLTYIRTYSGGAELWIALMLAYYYGLRRGEICALTSEDLEGDVLTISKDVVMDENKQWITKNIPKTADSFRSLRLSGAVLEALKEKHGHFITCNPDALLSRFKRAIKAAGIKPFNFHILRHCYASRAAVMGVPDIYVAKMGGWKPGSPILKQVYQNALDKELIKQMDRMNEVVP